ncbi:MAG: hypothetical protein F2667_09900 [Actinobacteria bacterium]|uniref:Unannotated protein n=1 Tax=freshwater metagenome TaxID=449393 RepID=A0A6J6R9I5_9ZZZZ|nr:hypothetical protein [Actinomycetota bacterium]
MRYAAALVLMLVLGACSDSPATTGRAEPADADTATRAEVCALVVTGIAAFNAGDYEATVAAFERAVPLARGAAAADDSTAAADLLEAVEYYADLPPEEYLESAATSPDFARYKQVTLGQCGDGRPGSGASSEESPGVPV